MSAKDSKNAQQLANQDLLFSQAQYDDKPSELTAAVATAEVIAITKTKNFTEPVHTNNNIPNNNITKSENHPQLQQQQQPTVENNMPTRSRMTIPDSTSDFKDWLEGIKVVVRLPGMPIEFRRKLWLALAERYLRRRGIDWEIEKIKWLSEKSRADDEELGVQIVKDLHRTGHSLLSGPNGALNQAKLKRILMGYTRWNPEVGYCQGFNMLGAIILQVMDKNEVDSIKVMIFLIEGILPNGYFSGSLMGLQVDMAVFRELLGNKLPKLARHLQKLQYPANEPSVEPPLINVFTMQWFLTLFCNCLPMICVLRIWDLIMIEGSDVLLRTALALWKLMEDRILREVRSADDFYCKMETLSAELLDESRVDSNLMIQMICDLGPIKDLQKLRQKHLTASYQDQKQLKMIYSKVQGESERLALQHNRTRRNSQLQREQSDREKIAIDITILKKQYDKLKERQKQAHIILTSAVTKQNQQKHQQAPTNVNKLLAGKHAIISKGGRRAPPKGAIPPARKISKNSKNQPAAQATTSNNNPEVNFANRNKDESIQLILSDDTVCRKNSLTWKEINAESSRKRSDSSSYSENSDTESSTSTSFCDDENMPSLDTTPVKKKRTIDKEENRCVTIEQMTVPKLCEIKSCPEIALEILKESNDDAAAAAKVEENNDYLSSGASKYHIDLSPDFDFGISSISQLSPLPDMSTYFTAISPIKTPCNYFEFPDFSNFTICNRLSNNEKYEVNEHGVTNEFFERVTSSNVFNVLPSNISYDLSYLSRELPQSSSDDSTLRCDYDRKISQSNSPKSMRTSIPFDTKEKSVLKYVNQKSFSMEEGTVNNEDNIKINRSYSDGTIMECDDFEKIIAENSKILFKMRTFADSNENFPTSTNTKLIQDTIIEETKTSSNSSECEEIAAIDNEEPSISEVGLPQVQDIAEMELAEPRNNDTENSYTTLSRLACNTLAHVNDDVMLQNEKSMNEDKNSDAMATLQAQRICSSNSIVHNNTTTAELNTFAQKTLPLNDVVSNFDENENPTSDNYDTINSPKFEEISELVDKLKKEVMESEIIVSEKKNEVKVDVKDDCSAFKDIDKLNVECSVEDKIDETIASATVKINITGMEKTEKYCQRNMGDLEKSTANGASATETKQQKVDSENISNPIASKHNVKLINCQEQPKDHNIVNNANIPTTAITVDDVGKENENIITTGGSLSEPKSGLQKDSSKILEKLNFQLQRYEDTRSTSSALSTSLSPSNERSNNYKRELEVLIKEREFEKNQIYRKDGLSPSNSFHYDHELGNENQRRDVSSSLGMLDTRIRRPFKSSPTSSFSSSPSNISNTLSSIQDTIKSLDSACQRSEIYNYKKLDKAMENIEKICESDKDWHYYKRIKAFESPPSFKIDEILTTTKIQRNFLDDDMTLETLQFSRYDSGNISSKKPITPELDAHYIAKLRCLSTEEYIAGRKSPVVLSPTREIRYSRIDRSPTSPILSSSRFLKSPAGDRGSKSAENSPSRYTSEIITGTTKSRYAPSTSSTDLSKLSYESTAMTDSVHSSRKYYDWEKKTTATTKNFTSSLSRKKLDI